AAQRPQEVDVESCWMERPTARGVRGDRPRALREHVGEAPDSMPAYLRFVEVRPALVEPRAGVCGDLRPVDWLDVDDLTGDGQVSVLACVLACRRRQSRHTRGCSGSVAEADRHGDHARVPGFRFRAEFSWLMCHDGGLLSAGEAGDQGLVSWSPALRFCGSALHHGLVNVPVVDLSSDALAAEFPGDFLSHGDAPVTTTPAC